MGRFIRRSIRGYVLASSLAAILVSGCYNPPSRTNTDSDAQVQRDGHAEYDEGNDKQDGPEVPYDAGVDAPLDSGNDSKVYDSGADVGNDNYIPDMGVDSTLPVDAGVDTTVSYDGSIAADTTVPYDAGIDTSVSPDGSVFPDGFIIIFPDAGADGLTDMGPDIGLDGLVTADLGIDAPGILPDIGIDAPPVLPDIGIDSYIPPDIGIDIPIVSQCTPPAQELRACSTDIGECVAGTETFDCLPNGSGGGYWQSLNDCTGVFGTSEDRDASGSCTLADLNGKDDDCSGTLDEICTVLVPAGSYFIGYDSAVNPSTQGDEAAHTVVLGPTDMKLFKYETTVGQYRECVAQGGCTVPINLTSWTDAGYYDNPAKANYPVIHVDWNQADAYCTWAGGRLPTEVEWEAAARGTDHRTYPWGNADLIDCSTMVNAFFNLGCTTDVTEVGSFPDGASPYGAMDLAGNVEEWVRDWYAAYDLGDLNNPTGPVLGANKVYRGGKWSTTLAGKRALFTYTRASSTINFEGIARGFRCIYVDPENIN